MNDLEVLKNWHHRRLNETIEEHDMRMDSGPPRNVLAALHRENERENSAMIPATTSCSSSNGGRGNAAKATRRAEAAAQEARRAGVRAASTSPTPPQDNLPPRQVSIFPALIPTLLPALDGDATRATAAPFLRDRAASVTTGCDWARVSLCLACGEGPSLVKCQMEGCARTLHHMCQTEWESAEEGQEAHGSKKMCAYHHPSLANRHPSCSMSASRKAVAPSGAVPRNDAANFPGVAAVATAMKDAIARWKTMPGPVEWCVASFEEMRHGVCLQMVVNGVHLQHKRGAKGLAWKDFYERTVLGSRIG